MCGPKAWQGSSPNGVVLKIKEGKVIGGEREQEIGEDSAGGEGENKRRTKQNHIKCHFSHKTIYLHNKGGGRGVTDLMCSYSYYFPFFLEM